MAGERRFAGACRYRLEIRRLVMTDDTLRLSPKAARKLIFEALIGAGTAERNAGYFADAILDTELSGLEGHGFYCTGRRPLAGDRNQPHFLCRPGEGGQDRLPHRSIRLGGHLDRGETGGR